MPFYYYGAKSKIAKHYPAPQYDTIIEPFAGSAGYARHFATPEHRVILIEKDERVAELWRRIQRMSVEDVQAMECPPVGDRCREPIINLTQASANTLTGRKFYDSQVTTRQARDWPKVQRRIIKSLPLIREWEIITGHCGIVAPDIEATWHVDPPYWVHPGRTKGTAGDGYAEGASAIDFQALGEWCKTRRGQVMVCEQLGASWLPFRPLVEIQTTASMPSRRTEVIWTNDSEQCFESEAVA